MCVCVCGGGGGGGSPQRVNEKLKLDIYLHVALGSVPFNYPHVFLNKRVLGPWVAHLRMTDQWSGTICEILVGAS